MSRGLKELQIACRKLDTHRMSDEGIEAWYDLSKLMPNPARIVVQKRIRDQLAQEQGIPTENDEVMPTFEPFIEELMKESPETVTDGFKNARKVIGETIMNEYIKDVAEHLKKISGVV